MNTLTEILDNYPTLEAFLDRSTVILMEDLRKELSDLLFRITMVRGNEAIAEELTRKEDMRENVA